MALKILITNDDGIYAEGIKILIEKVKNLGEVLVVAPKTEQSAKSHGITLRNPFEVREVDIFKNVRAYYVDSTPADCVRYAYYGLKYDFDILLSGINKGYNIGYDIMYSGTVAAAFESSSLDKPAIALSCCWESFSGFDKFGNEIINYFTNNKLLDKWKLYNINIPVNPKGIRITEQGYSNFITFYTDYPEGKKQEGIDIMDKDIKNISLDTACVMNDYISITPLTHKRTEYNIYNELKKLN